MKLTSISDSAKKVGLPCPHCDSSDAYGLDERGWGHCFSCGANDPPAAAHITHDRPIREPEVQAKNKPFTPLADRKGHDWPSRGLSAATIDHYRVDLGDYEAATYKARYPLFDTNGNHVANKVRMKGDKKEFYFEGNPREAGLFGRHAFTGQEGKACTICEGQDDAMAAYQMQGNKYACFSVHSAASAAKDIERDFEFVNQYDKIVLCFDDDEAGRKAIKAVTELPFPSGKLHVMPHTCGMKDANDYLIKGKTKEFMDAWWKAAPQRPDNLKMGTDLWPEIADRKESFTVQYPWDGLNTKTYGIRLSELVTFTAETGVGKTSVLKTIEHMLLTDKTVIENDYGVGFLHLEETNGDTALGLISIHNGVPYHLPDRDRPVEDIRRAYDELLNNDRVVVYDHFGSNSVDAILNKVRHMVALGCKYIVLDHLSIVVSDQSGDERKQLDEITTKLKTLTMELDIAVLTVVHVNRAGQIRGTAGIEQLSNIVIRLERDKLDMNDWRRNITRLTVEKNRFCGRTGPAAWLYYDENTSRLQELTPPEVAIYEAGGSLIEDEPLDNDTPYV